MESGIDMTNPNFRSSCGDFKVGFNMAIVFNLVGKFHASLFLLLKGVVPLCKV
jgi:hypothetical protein